jgi:hypothetical protein
MIRNGPTFDDHGGLFAGLARCRFRGSLVLIVAPPAD